MTLLASARLCRLLSIQYAQIPGINHLKIPLTGDSPLLRAPLDWARLNATLKENHPVTVLIVDDCATMRKAIRLTLQDLADATFEAADAQTALDLYVTHRPAWVTLDLAMEPVDGFTAMRRIKSYDPAARIIVVTGYDIDVFRDAAKSRGAAGYILKDDLRKVRDLIQATPVASPVAPAPPQLSNLA